MKAMKATKKTSMKSTKKKSIIASGRMAKSMVLSGAREHTTSGLKATDLTKNKYGKVVSKKQSAASKKNPWIIACKAARKALGSKGMCCVGGKTPQGRALYQKARSLMK